MSQDTYDSVKAKSLIDAYRILGEAAHSAYNDVQNVPMPIAKTILHARDYIGNQYAEELLGKREEVQVSPEVKL